MAFFDRIFGMLEIKISKSDFEIHIQRSRNKSYSDFCQISFFNLGRDDALIIQQANRTGMKRDNYIITSRIEGVIIT